MGRFRETIADALRQRLVMINLGMASKCPETAIPDNPTICPMKISS